MRLPCVRSSFLLPALLLTAAASSSTAAQSRSDPTFAPLSEASVLLEEASVHGSGGRAIVRVQYRAPGGAGLLPGPHYVGVSLEGARVSEPPPELLSDAARGWLADVAALRKRPDLLTQEWDALIDEAIALRKRPDLLTQEWDALINEAIALRKRPDLLTQEWDALINEAIALLASPPRRAHWKAELVAVMDDDLNLRRGAADPLSPQWDQLIDQALRLRKRPDLLSQEWDALIQHTLELRRKPDAVQEWDALADKAIRLLTQQVALFGDRDALMADTLAFAARMDGLGKQWQVIAAQHSGDMPASSNPFYEDNKGRNNPMFQEGPPVTVVVTVDVDAQALRLGLTGKVGVYDEWGHLKASTPLQSR